MKNKLVVIIAILVTLFSAAFAAADQSITLKPGFNFISFTQSISLTPAQLKDLSPFIEDLYLFNASAGSFLSLNEGTLTALASAKGYIVKSNCVSEISITIPGSLISLAGNVSLKTGFNLAGFSKMPETIKFSELMTRYSKIKGMYKWNAAAGAFLQVIRNASSGAIEQIDGTDPTMKAGESYFINMAEDQPLNYDGSSIVIGDAPAPSTVKIAFTSTRGDSNLSAIYTMNTDGSSQTKISNHDFAVHSPVISPDGSKVAYVSDSSSQYNIYLMNIDGSNVKQLTTDGSSFYPAWSPDGLKLAYASPTEIWTMNADGTNKTKLNITLTGSLSSLAAPCWSPDGSKIAVTGWHSASANIHLINVATQTMTQLSYNVGINTGASWSPDGTKIAFASDQTSSTSSFKIYVMSADGKSQTQLTTADVSQHSLRYSWSADSSKILFSESRAGDNNYMQIYMMNSDGSNVIRLTDPSTKNNSSPSFPAPSKIAVTSR